MKSYNPLRAIVGALTRSKTLAKPIPKFDAIIDPGAAAARSKIAALHHERQQLEAADREARAALAAADETAATANTEHARLLRLCEGLEATNPSGVPHEQLGKALVAAVKANTAFKAATQSAELAASRNRDRGAEIRREIGAIEHALLKGRLHALIAEFERRVQVGELGWLSDEIRKAAAAVSMRPEPDAPLMTEGRLTICGYPLRAWE